jgi:hypothetical protein
MSYLLNKPLLQKDLYIKKKFTVSDSTTPWIPQVNITLNSIKVELKDTATGTGNSVLRIWENRGASNQAIIFDATFSANDAIKQTNSSFSRSVTSGAEITYSITQITTGDAGGEAIISFVYENA